VVVVVVVVLEKVSAGRVNIVVNGVDDDVEGTMLATSSVDGRIDKTDDVGIVTVVGS